MMSRTAGPLLAGLVFTVTLGGAGAWWIQTALLPARVDRPLLSEREMERLPSFARPCTTREECEPPLECVDDPRMRLFRCLGQECWSDAQCKPGYLCRSVPALGEGRSVRLCLLEGIRSEGERCEEFPVRAEEACRPGLSCKFWYCGRPCRPDEPSSCPRGQACVSTLGSPSCVPSCQKTGCPAGKHCVRLTGEFSVCATLEGPDCEENPCPEGRECVTSVETSRAPVMRRTCEQPCDGQRFCPPGFTCLAGNCKQTCDPKKPEDCGSEETCNLSRYIPPTYVCERRNAYGRP